MFYGVSGGRDRQIGFGLVSVPNHPAKPRVALLSEPIENGGQLHMRLFTRMGQIFLHAPASLKERIDTPVSAIYLYVLEGVMAKSISKQEQDAVQVPDWDQVAASAASA